MALLFFGIPCVPGFLVLSRRRALGTSMPNADGRERRSLSVFWVLVFLLLPLSAEAEENILLFSSTARVYEDFSLEVREDITVNVEGKEIRRGIYREFPTEYRDEKGDVVRIGFSVETVLLNGEKLPYRTERRNEGSYRVYLGDPDAFAPRGPQTYTLVYVVTGVIGFFDDHDELYWNVTGNGWSFRIDKARFSLSLPDEAPFDMIYFFTGLYRARGKDARILPDGSVETTSPLVPGEGLTVVYEWGKDVLEPAYEPLPPIGEEISLPDQGHSPDDTPPSRPEGTP